MKKGLLFLCLFIVIVSLNAQEMKEQKMRYQAVLVKQATILQEGERKNYCSICGMTLPMFYKTNHVATNEKVIKQYCSIHCLMEDKIMNKTDLKELKVVDNTTLKFINVEEAFYVIGSNKPGTMSTVSKYAFAKKEDAKRFAKVNKGEVKRFDAISKIVEDGLNKEKEKIAKKQAKMAETGEKLYKKMCKKTNMKFSSIGEAKAYITVNKLCGEMRGKNLQAVGIYLSRR